MKTLIIIRHAKSSWDQPSLSDHQRPLSARGLRDATRIFERFALHNHTLDVVVSSDAVRAQATTELFTSALAVDEARVRYDHALYLANSSKLLDIVQGLDDRSASAGIVGHNPGFTELANWLAIDLELDNLPTCGIVGLVFAVEDWSEVRPELGKLCYLDYPKNRQDPIIPS